MNKHFYSHPLIFDFLFLISLISVFLTYYYNVSYFRITSVLFGLACLWWHKERLSPTTWFSFLLIGTPLLLFSLLNSIHTTGVSVVAFIVLACQLAISSYYVRNAEHTHLLSIAYLSFLLYSIYKIVVDNYGPENFDVFFAGIGRNGYSSILFSLLIGYCTEKLLTKKPISVSAVTLGFLTMIPLYGRSSIIATGIVLFGSLLKGSRRQLAFYGLIVMAAMIYVTAYKDFEISRLLEITNFRAGTESERWDVFNEWMDKLGPIEFITGHHLADLNFVIALDGNPHNAFIRLHSFFGLSTFILIGGLLTSFFYMVFDKQYFLICMFIAIIFKCFFDIIYFVGDQDFLLYPIIFYTLFRPQFLKSTTSNSD